MQAATLAPMKPPFGLIAVVLLLGCTCAGAQWQWRDNDGRRVFSDRAPPPEVPEKNILQRPGAPARAASDGASAAQSPALPRTSGVDKDIEAQKKQAADAEAAKAKAEQDKLAKAKMENCARAKQAKATYDSGARLARTNASGEREIMDDTARAAEGKRIQSVIDANCQ